MLKDQSAPEERFTVIDINIKFSKKICTLLVTLDNKSIEKYKIKFNEEKFNTNAEKTLKSKGVSILDIININTLYLIKLSEHLLTEVIKKSILGINKLDTLNLLKDVILEDIKTEDQRKKLINERVKLANSYAEEIIGYLEIKFKRINDEIETMNCNVFDRTELIKKCKEEILDNVYKKHALVINEIIHLAHRRELPDDVIDESELDKIIESFK